MRGQQSQLCVNQELTQKGVPDGRNFTVNRYRVGKWKRERRSIMGWRERQNQRGESNEEQADMNDLLVTRAQADIQAWAIAMSQALVRGPEAAERA